MSYNPIKTANNEININATNITVSNNILIDNDPTLLYTDASTNRIGVLTTTPAYTFDVSGSINAQQVLVNGSPLVSSYWSANSNDIYNINSGNVGINNSTPSHKLDISGNINSNSNYLINGTSVLSSTTLGAGVVNSNLTSVGTLNGLDVSGNVNFTNSNLDMNTGKLLNVTNIDTINNNINLRTLSDNDINIIRNTSGTNLSLKATEITTNSDLNMGNQTLKTQNVDNSGATLNLGNNSTSINIGCGNNIQTVNIGSNSSLGVTTINIGGSGDIVNIDGSLNYIYSTNLKVAEKTIFLNSNSSGSGTARNSGISIRDNNIDNQGYIQVSSLGTSFEFKAPESGNILSSPVLTGNQTIYTTGGGTISGSVNLTSGNTYKINNTDVLSSSTLGSGVTASSLTSVGTLNGLNVNNNIKILPASSTVGGFLSIDSSANSGGKEYLLFSTSSGNVGGAGCLNIWDNNAGASRLFINSSGNIGLGITNPSHKLDVVGNIYANNISNCFVTVRANSGSGCQLFQNTSEMGLFSTDNLPMNLYTNNTRRITILGDGNVGIGVTNPNYKLEVRGFFNASRENGYTRSNYDTDSNARYDNILNLFSGDTNYSSYWGHSFMLNQGLAGDNAGATETRIPGTTSFTINTKTNATTGFNTLFTVRNSGNVGIGTTNPLTILQTNFTSSNSTLTGLSSFGGLHIQPTNNTNDLYNGITFGGIDPTQGSPRQQTQAGILCQSSSAYGTRLHFLTSNSYASGMSLRMLLDPAGRLGIGTTNPGYLLDIAGTANVSASNYYRINGAKIGQTLGFRVLLSATPSISRVTPSSWDNGSTIVRNGVGDYTLTLNLLQNAPSTTGCVVASFESSANHKYRVVANYAVSNQIGILTFNNDAASDLGEQVYIMLNYD